ncbi:hypothetical protein V1478_004462 [Vespula squamosa]|uniref:Uncharacterized protein n=1 Tax=Vespula squamosa TaxID=30214 RepID=A0ABD2BGM0_VESSQ
MLRSEILKDGNPITVHLAIIVPALLLDKSTPKHQAFGYRGYRPSISQEEPNRISINDPTRVFSIGTNELNLMQRNIGNLAEFYHTLGARMNAGRNEDALSIKGNSTIVL